ncbi:molybdopterin-dependent oxidoreductase [Ferruginibacter sp. SUN002]|uniref:molybdopterin-dependent oxidoreductase n=1 Tax=Ferruginibacter sp. SUN002 TaxID=2937789 RepID=UPI003D36B765
MQEEKIISSKEIRRKTIIAFVIFFGLMLLAYCGWKWLNNQPTNNGALKPLRSVLNLNESIFNNYVFDSNNISKKYPLAAVDLRTRINGDAGLSSGFDPATWKLQVVRKPGDTLFISLDEIKALPKTEVIFDFKCIEGWSQVTFWAGVKFSDFIKKYNLDQQAQMKYTGLITPDKGYYVGIDNKSMLQSQTILCYELNGNPLPMNQGAPLRLIIPVKYGVKHLKRIGTISFSNTRPADYWYERGYDYYCGL